MLLAKRLLADASQVRPLIYGSVGLLQLGPEPEGRPLEGAHAQGAQGAFRIRSANSPHPRHFLLPKLGGT
jgi:hypothetical protein